MKIKIAEVLLCAIAVAHVLAIAIRPHTRSSAETGQLAPSQRPITTVTATQTATQPPAQQASSETEDGGSDG